MCSLVARVTNAFGAPALVSALVLALLDSVRMRPPGIQYKGQARNPDLLQHDEASTASGSSRSSPAQLPALDGPPSTLSDGSLREAKRAAIIRGLDYLQRSGEAMFRNDNLASRHGADLMLPFYVPRPSSAGSPEERHAWRVATRLASEWRSRTVKRASYLPPRVPPAELLDLMQGLYSLECLGMAEPTVHAAVLERSAAWGAIDYFKYDPAAGEPHDQLRELCMCGARPPAAASECPHCRRPAIPMSKFDVWLEALVWSFHGCRMRIGLGACFFDVLRQVCAAFGHLFPRRATLQQKDRHYLTYALTHVIYALNNFDERSLDPALFPPSVPTFMKEQLRAAIDADDPDLAGELLDCLKCLGEGGTPESVAAERFLLSAQSSADGGWVCKGEADLYSRYHASLVAVAALMDHTYAAHGPVFPRAADVLPAWFGGTSAAHDAKLAVAQYRISASNGANTCGDGGVAATSRAMDELEVCKEVEWVGPDWSRAGFDCGAQSGGGGGQSDGSADACRGCRALAPTACDAQPSTCDVTTGASVDMLCLCDVDHTHAEARRLAAEACRESETLVPQYPLPPQQRRVVSMLPVMRRIHVREALLADKRRQHSHGLQLEARALNHRKFVDRGGGINAFRDLTRHHAAAATAPAAASFAVAAAAAMEAEMALAGRGGSQRSFLDRASLSYSSAPDRVGTAAASLAASTSARPLATPTTGRLPSLARSCGATSVGNVSAPKRVVSAPHPPAAAQPTQRWQSSSLRLT